MTDNDKTIVRYADEAMFTAKPLVTEGDEVRPHVTVIDMTSDPLRKITAVAALYHGGIVRDPTTVSREEAMATVRGIGLSKIAAPAEWVRISLFFEGVSRAFTHQLVRQRTATFVQESLRFAVKENAAWEIVLPPSLAGKPGDDPARQVWEDDVRKAAWSYNALIGAGMPAEDARGLLPTNIATRVHYTTDLRNLIDHSGLRLCSQAQHEWKQVWVEIIRAILAYGPEEDRWQQREIARLFRPICYQTGRCEFMGADDRYCVIRERVEAHHERGERPELWTDIDPHACLHPEAARR
jgi:flavin-dependent thymidylate synthase